MNTCTIDGFELKLAAGGASRTSAPPDAGGRSVAVIIQAIAQPAGIDFRVNLLVLYRETEKLFGASWKGS